MNSTLKTLFFFAAGLICAAVVYTFLIGDPRALLDKSIGSLDEEVVEVRQKEIPVIQASTASESTTKLSGTGIANRQDAQEVRKDMAKKYKFFGSEKKRQFNAEFFNKLKEMNKNR